MVQINFARKEINCKIVYYGPGLSGKTTNLEMVHARAPSENKGELTSISTDGDRTLFFDFMPLDLGTIAGMRTKFHIYTVPGQVYYNSTRKLVLLGADGIIFVADSSPGAMEANKQSLENLGENLVEMGKDLAKVPLVIQYNKRDIEGAMDVATMEAELNPIKVPSFEAVASKGEGVFKTLKAISSLVLESINSNDRKGSLLTATSHQQTKPAAAGPASAPAPREAVPSHQAAPAVQGVREPRPAAAAAASTMEPATAGAGQGAPPKSQGMEIERNHVPPPMHQAPAAQGSPAAGTMVAEPRAEAPGQAAAQDQRHGGVTPKSAPRIPQEYPKGEGVSRISSQQAKASAALRERIAHEGSRSAAPPVQRESPQVIGGKPKGAKGGGAAMKIVILVIVILLLAGAGVAYYLMM